VDDAVECHSEFAYAEKPVALTWQGRRHEIASILSRWRTPGGIRFHVRTADDEVFDLTYDETSDSWHIQQP
jgi:hypothetical protein